MNTQSLRSFALLAVLVVCGAAIPSSLTAQRGSAKDVVLVAPTPAVPAGVPAVRITPALAGPRIVAAGISRPAVTDTQALPRSNNLGNGNNVAMMVVGGAGIVVGSLIGDDAGYTIAVGGAIIGLIGLFRYLR
jgi:hypothetical protein